MSAAHKIETQKAQRNLELSTFGKIMPQAAQLEEAVLGAILLDKDALAVVLDILRITDFYFEAHQLVYASMLRLFEKSQPQDLLLVTEDLKKAGKLNEVGGPYFLVELTNRVASAANIEYHARIISQKAIQRDLIKAGTMIMRNAYDETTDVFELLDQCEQQMFEIGRRTSSSGAKGISQLLPEALRNIEAIARQPDGLTGVPSGFRDVDELTNGWQPSDLIIIAARPGMGKTALTLAIAQNAAIDYGKGVAIFSLEMSNLQLVQRLISMQCEIPGQRLRNGKLEDYEWQVLQSTIEKMAEVPIFIDDTPAINIFEVRAKARRLKMQHDIQMVIIDYLQLMGGNDNQKYGNREQEVSSISRSLKALAKELGIPVIALSQLSRAVETRGGTKRPQLSDLRESGAIEQDADMVGFIYRPEYYSILEDEEGNSLKGVSELIIAKNRHGALKTIKLKFIDRFAKFKDLDEESL